MALILASNLEPISSTQTSEKTGIFKPSRFVYRTAVTGAMLRAMLNLRGENFYTYFNRWIYERHSLTDNYLRMLQDLPRSWVSDGVLIKESCILRENYNIIMDGTATALGSIKRVQVEIETEKGRENVYGYQIFGLDSKGVRLVPNLLSHFFWAPGAIWRFALISNNEKELDRSLNLFRIAVREFGLGAKHSFRGRMRILSEDVLELREIDGNMRGELLQPLFCEEGIGNTMRKHGLIPVNIRIAQRVKGVPPHGKVVPAIWGEFIASKGYHVSDRGLIVTEADLSWPPFVS